MKGSFLTTQRVKNFNKFIQSAFTDELVLLLSLEVDSKTQSNEDKGGNKDESHYFVNDCWN